MTDLDALRAKIDEIDQTMATLYKERMDAVSEIADYKRETGGAIFHPRREEQVLQKVMSMAGEENAHKIRLLYKTLMRQSRERQYEIISDGLTIEDIIGCSISPEIMPSRAAYAGLAGSYTHIAAETFYPNIRLVSHDTFLGVLSAVALGSCDVGVLPIDNTTEGIVADVYEGLLKYGLYISDSITMPIRHCLLGLSQESKSKITTVFSHPQALGQCAGYISSHGYLAMPDINTSISAQKVSDAGNPELAAIGSSLAAEIYGLAILEENINDEKCNSTRFIAVTKQPVVNPAANRISLSFTMPHESGFLANILSIAADYDINLVNVQSLPLPQKPWEYRFYMDIYGSVYSSEVKAILYMLYKELPEMFFLGNYVDQS